MDKQIEFDLDWLYEASRRLGKRPTENDEVHFLELVGKQYNDDVDIANARRWALKQLYG